MERKWLELPTMGEAFCISKKDLYYIQDQLMQEHSVIRLLGRVIMLPLGTFMDCKYTSAKECQFRNGLYWFWYHGFAEQPSGELYTRWIQLGVFHPLQNTFLRRSWQEPWAFDEEVIDITRKFVNLRYNYYPYLYTMFWQYIEEEFPCLNP
jgi:hypothetical protein